ncbi:hypothetical protein H4R33_005907 [Dimargaris cristalligena]|nr:hypothetical protein H4R33_005907 [Dimargaris cristalligena]
MKALKDVTAAELKPLASDASPQVGQAHLQRRALIAAQPTITVAEALNILATHNIISLPIYSHYQADKIVNIVDIRDILAYVTSLPPNQTPDPNVAHAPSAVPESWKQKLESSIEAVMTLDPAKESYRFFQCEVQDSIRRVIAAFSSGIHRALVEDYSDSPRHPHPSFLLTQTDIICYVFEHPDVVPANLLNASLRELFPNAFNHPLFTVRNTDTAHSALQRMDCEYRTAAAVLDESGRIVDNMSASDLRGLTESTLLLLYAPVVNFLERLNPRRGSPITAQEHTTLRDLITQVWENRVHRSWVVDDQQHPIAVITHTDIIALFNERL